MPRPDQSRRRDATDVDDISEDARPAGPRLRSGVMLQNRYGDAEYPIRDRWPSARIYRQALLRARPGWASARNLVWMAPGIVLLAVPFVNTDGFSRVPNGDGLGVFLLLELVGFVVLIAAGLTVATWVDSRKARHEQQAYWRAVGAVPVTARQQQLLALDAQSDYGFGGWNSTLDYGPAWSRLPAAMQQRHEQDPKWQPFLTMPPMDTDRLRAQLDSQWHIASKPDLELFVADALSTRSLSTSYTQILAGEQGPRMLARVASLTGVSEWDLRALAEPDTGRPAAALWAADTQRVVSVVRTGYLAGHLDDTTAWELIERAAGPGTSLFTGWDQYWANVRIGLAFQTDSLEQVQRFDHTLHALRASSWPAAHAAFPTSPVPDWLPRTPAPGGETPAE